uniref:Uncharacterized protein n=1 Tax=Romanomermis culicivorax TaxID=13658 RepID=A0A915HSG1_ROMCU
FAFLIEFHPTKSDLVRLNLDGSNILRFNQLATDFQPFALTLDLPNEQIYYLDVYLESIFSIDYSAKNRRRLIAVGQYVKMLNRLATFESFLYATDHYMNYVWKISIKNSSYVKSTANKEFSRADTIRIFHRQKQPDGKHPCSSNLGGCDHFCIVDYSNRSTTLQPVAKCTCKNGYKLENATKCTPALSYPFIMFGKTHPGSIIGLPLENFSYQAIKPIQNLYRPTSFDYLHQSGEIFFVDGHSSSIKKQKVNDNAFEVVMSLGLSNCEGIALDWTSLNLYWSDESFVAINVLKIANSSIRRSVASGNMTHPRALAVDPFAGLLFWSDWIHLWIQSSTNSKETVKKSAKIERCNLDGSDRRPIVSSSIYWPNGIALDRRNQLLFWCDALFDRVESVKFDGTQR